MSVKIQINSLEALERLIGGDTEVEIDLRNSVVQEFTKKHLKGIANLTMVTTAKYEVSKETEKVTADYFKKAQWNKDAEPSEKLTVLIKKYANEQYEAIVKDAIYKAQSAVGKMIEEEVFKGAADYVSSQKFQDYIQQKIDQAVSVEIENRFKAALKAVNKKR